MQGEMLSPEQLFATLNRVFDTVQVKELGLIMEPDFSSSYAPFTVADASLGVPFAVIIAIAGYAQEQFNTLRQGSITQHAKDVIAVTRAMLLVNADCYPALNARKVLIQEGMCEPGSEIAFIDFVFTKHPKSGEMWAHRRWVVQFAQDHQRTPQPDIINGELRTCTRVAEAYPKNYYAWSHRQWVIQERELPVLASDFCSMHDWCTTHVSDHSGFHHRARVLLLIAKRVFQGSSVVEDLIHDTLQTPIPLATSTALTNATNDSPLCRLFLHELQWLTAMILFYPGHETLWSHRRFVALALHAVVHALGNGSAEVTRGSAQITSLTTLLQTSTERLDVTPFPISGDMQGEGELLSHCLATTIAERYEDQCRYSALYSVWLGARLSGAQADFATVVPPALSRLQDESAPALATRAKQQALQCALVRRRK